MKPHRFGVLVPRGRGDRSFRALLKILHVAAKFFKDSSYCRQVVQEIARYCRNEIKISPKSRRPWSLFGPIQNAS
jgi:hypothetical protein